VQRSKTIALPQLLAGPNLRRTEPTRVCVWFATACEASITVRVAELSGDTLGEGTAESVQLGRNLFVHLAQVFPVHSQFPTDRLLAYDMEFMFGDQRFKPADLNLLDTENGITLPGFDLPTFFIRDALQQLNMLHGSCRLLHGKGEDAIRAAHDAIVESAGDPSRRPALLVFTGDQVYADEVAGPLIGWVRELATELIGSEDETSVPGIGRLTDFGVYGRAEIATQRANLTSGKADNHLMSFGEWVAMYLLAWSEAAWPGSFPDTDMAVPDDFGSRTSVVRARNRYNDEARNLQRARSTIPLLRRVFANIPSYMIFDDHDVTDDWNLNRAWREAVFSSPTGRRAIANALASFWAFQGWGNNPDEFSSEFKRTVALHGSGRATERTDRELWGFDRWSYFIPADIPIVVLDTRTQRTYDSRDGAAHLIGAKEQQRTVANARAAGHRPGDPLILVSAVPVFGLELQERRQKFLVGKLGPYEIDFEAWHSNLQGLVNFLHMLIDDIGLRTCLILSGDVHYGLNARARFCVGDKELTVLQLVSSALKHSGAMSKSALNLLGRMVTRKHERIGWDRPPELPTSNGLKKRALTRATNTDEWNDDAPVFLGPKRATALGISQPPDYLECRIYIPPEDAGSMLVGENNIGLVSIDPKEITHRLMALGPSGTTEHIARIAADDGLAELAPQEW
jgi:hypothetical protein